MRKEVVAVVVGLVLGGALAGCTVKPSRSDSGFSGTWSRRGIIGDYTSTVSIVERHDGPLFRWKLDTDDRKWSVRCGWDGQCEEWLDGKKIAKYEFKVGKGALETELVVDCTRTPLLDDGRGGYHYVDDLVLEPGGLKMTAYTREYNGDKYGREATAVKHFDKVADAIADPPAETRP